ncbi:MAG: 2'-5' RNA ligase family protein [Proteobacteria bacterium]|nr:2'-5' RNA ligase family protein [Pseudomonadota bacterium]
MQQLALSDMFGSRANRRLFLGIWPGEVAVDELDQLMERLRRDGTIPGRTVDRDRLHVTLLHLDDFVDQIPPSLITAVQTAAASLQFKPFDVAFDRVCCTAKHVLLFPSDALAELQEFRAALRSALLAQGVSTLLSAKARQAIGRPYNPHVTLSYNPGSAPEKQVEPIRWTVRGFHLVESLLGRHQHIRLNSWALGT